MKAIGKPTQAALAASLGIDPALVTRYKRRGMPVNSVAEAVRWRDTNIRARVGETTNLEGVSAAFHGEEVARTASTMLQAAGELLQSGGDVSALVSSLRQALAAVPPSWRDQVLAPFNVLDVLTLDVARAMDQGDPGVRICGVLYQARQANGEEIDMGAFWYAAAAGEVLVGPIRA
jgi:hypothetical protein